MDYRIGHFPLANAIKEETDKRKKERKRERGNVKGKGKKR
jgi:hypothetical protein